MKRAAFATILLLAASQAFSVEHLWVRGFWTTVSPNRHRADQESARLDIVTEHCDETFVHEDIILYYEAEDDNTLIDGKNWLYYMRGGEVKSCKIVRIILL